MILQLRDQLSFYKVSINDKIRVCDPGLDKIHDLCSNDLFIITLIIYFTLTQTKDETKTVNESHSRINIGEGTLCYCKHLLRCIDNEPNNMDCRDVNHRNTMRRKVTYTCLFSSFSLSSINTINFVYENITLTNS